MRAEELLGKRRAHKQGFSLHRFAYKLQKFALFHDLKSEFFNSEPSEPFCHERLHCQSLVLPIIFVLSCKCSHHFTCHCSRVVALL